MQNTFTIDDAIGQCEAAAAALEKGYHDPDGNWCKCASIAAENRQMAEWLRELKIYKDFEDKGYVMCRFEVAQDDRHRTTKMVLDFSTRKLFDNIVEVNADDE